MANFLCGAAADAIADEIEIEDAPAGATVVGGGPNQFKFSAQLSIVVAVACALCTFSKKNLETNRNKLNS
jgi:hypothetical protein